MQQYTIIELQDDFKFSVEDAEKIISFQGKLFQTEELIQENQAQAIQQDEEKYKLNLTKMQQIIEDKKLQAQNYINKNQQFKCLFTDWPIQCRWHDDRDDTDPYEIWLSFVWFWGCIIGIILGLDQLSNNWNSLSSEDCGLIIAGVIFAFILWFWLWPVWLADWRWWIVILWPIFAIIGAGRFGYKKIIIKPDEQAIEENKVQLAYFIKQLEILQKLKDSLSNKQKSDNKSGQKLELLNTEANNLLAVHQEIKETEGHCFSEYNHDVEEIPVDTKISNNKLYVVGRQQSQFAGAGEKDQELIHLEFQQDNQGKKQQGYILARQNSQ